MDCPRAHPISSCPLLSPVTLPSSFSSAPVTHIPPSTVTQPASNRPHNHKVLPVPSQSPNLLSLFPWALGQPALSMFCVWRPFSRLHGHPYFRPSCANSTTSPQESWGRQDAEGSLLRRCPHLTHPKAVLNPCSGIHPAGSGLAKPSSTPSISVPCL